MLKIAKSKKLQESKKLKEAFSKIKIKVSLFYFILWAFEIKNKKRKKNFI